MGLVKIIFLGALAVWAGTATAKDHDIWCREIFTSLHFPESVHKRERDTVTPDYSEWSAKVANEARTIFQLGATTSKKIEWLFDDVSNARVRFQYRYFEGRYAEFYGILNVPPDGDYSLRRKHQVDFGIVFFDGQRDIVSAHGPTAALAFATIKSILPSQISDEGRSSFELAHTYTDLNGQPVPLKVIGGDVGSCHNGSFYGQMKSITEVYMPERGFAVAKARLALALETDDFHRSMEQFTKAVYVYFASMPYVRGSAATGRIVFSVVGREIFGRAIKLDSEIDIRALLMSEGDFTSWLQGEILNQLNPNPTYEYHFHGSPISSR
jgi:hypothetical protein